MPSLGMQELVILLVIVLILFGAKRLPDLAKSLGSSVKEFKKGVTDITKDDTAAATTTTPPPTPTAKEEEKKA